MDTAAVRAAWEQARDGVTTPAADLNQWWRIWSDPVLDELQTTAVAGSPDLRQAAYQLAQSQMQLGLVDAAHLPQAEFGAEYSRAGISANSPLARLGAYTGAYNTFSLGVQAQWELDLWGHQRLQSEAASARVDGARASAAAAKVSLSAEVSRQYWLLRGLQVQQQLLQQQVQLSREALALSESRVRNGVASDSEIATAQAELDGLRAQGATMARQARLLTNSLTLMLGLSPRELDARLQADAAKLPGAAPHVPVDLPSELARQRPDILRADAQLRAAVADIGVARSDFYPRISLGAGLGTAAFDVSDLGSWSSRQFGFGPQLHLPLFEGGRLKQALLLSEVRHQEATLAYQTTVLRAWHEVDDALAAYRSEQERQTALHTALRQQEQAWQLARRAVEQGLADRRSENGAHRRVVAAQAALADSQMACALAVVGLFRALGGGWSRELGDAFSTARAGA